MRYFDASALPKRYVREPGSLKVRRLLASDAPATSRLSAVEIVSALMRRSREGAVSDPDCRRAVGAVTADLAAMLVVELSSEIVTIAQTLLQRYPLRASDAVQLASCLYLREALEDEITFVAFDARLSSAARGERLRLA